MADVADYAAAPSGSFALSFPENKEVPIDLNTDYAKYVAKSGLGIVSFMVRKTRNNPRLRVSINESIQFDQELGDFDPMRCIQFKYDLAKLEPKNSLYFHIVNDPGTCKIDNIVVWFQRKA